MQMQSRWLICGYQTRTDKWSPVSSLPPQLTPNLFYEVVEKQRCNYDHFGVYVVNGSWNQKSSFVPNECVRSIDEIFVDQSQINMSDDIIEGMTFFRNDDKSKVVKVLAQRLGWLMILSSGEGQKPWLIHWENLLRDYTLTSAFRKSQGAL